MIRRSKCWEAFGILPATFRQRASRLTGGARRPCRRRGVVQGRCGHQYPGSVGGATRDESILPPLRLLGLNTPPLYLPTMKTPHWLPFGAAGAPFCIGSAIPPFCGAATERVACADPVALLLAAGAGVDAELGPGADEGRSVNDRKLARGRRIIPLDDLLE